MYLLGRVEGNFDHHLIDECGENRCNTSTPDCIKKLRKSNFQPLRCADGIHICSNVKKYFLDTHFIEEDEYRIFSDSFIHTVFLLPAPSHSGQTVWKWMRANEVNFQFSFRVYDYIGSILVLSDHYRENCLFVKISSSEEKNPPNSTETFAESKIDTSVQYWWVVTCFLYIMPSKSFKIPSKMFQKGALHVLLGTYTPCPKIILDAPLYSLENKRVSYFVVMTNSSPSHKNPSEGAIIHERWTKERSKRHQKMNGQRIVIISRVACFK